MIYTPRRLGSVRYSDRSIFRQVDIPTGRYSDRSIFRQVVIPTGRYSDRSLFRHVDIPTGRYSNRSIFQQVDIPTGRYSNRSLFRQFFDVNYNGNSLWDEPLLITCLSPKDLKSVSNAEFHADSVIPFLKCLRRYIFSEYSILCVFSYKNGKIAILTSDTV